ncbi:hypothetical protein DL93DRAFT_52428 [Clavulina sp. PMI_390]|nr:hypothetical protein DL93DRAFT_52428 [Clavulina sp. PMI_390]
MAKNAALSVRAIFWGVTFMPLVWLIIQMGPAEFFRLAYQICTVDNSLPTSSVVTNAPGYAIIDHLYVFSGTSYIVSDDEKTSNDAKAIVVSSCPSGKAECAGALKVVSPSEAREIFGRFVHKVPGVAFLSTVTSLPSSAYLDQVLAGLWRTYASLNLSQAISPRKLLLPSIEQMPMATNSTPSFVSVELKQRWQEYAEHNEARKFERAVIAYGRSDE